MKLLPNQKVKTLFFWTLTVLFTCHSYGQETKKKLRLPVPESIDGSDEDESGSIDDLKGLTYQQLNDLRIPRTLLLDYLKAEGKIREAPNGSVDFLEQVNDIARKAVKEENRVRRQLFTVIATREKRAIASIGREFHQEITALPEKVSKPTAPPKDLPTSLRISAPFSIGNSMVSGLITGYLKSLGYGDVHTEKRGEITRVTGKRKFGSGYIAVDVEPRLPEANEFPKEKCILFETGSVSGAAPPNTIALDALAIVVHPDNAVASLTISQIADIFSGDIESWDKLSGSDEDITVLIPGARPFLNSQFQDFVMKPERERIKTSETQDDFLSQLESNPNAITFCYASELTGKLKPIRIKASREGLPLAPSIVNVKSLDYPLVTRISLQTIKSTDSFMEEFIAFSQSAPGQQAVANSGFISNGEPSKKDEKTAIKHREFLLASEDVPDEYKELIRKADRLNSSANFRFVPQTTSFELTDYSKMNLDRLIALLKNNRGKKAILIGFADDQGDEEKNKIYSKKRADSVADKLREEGITSIETEGMGEEIPIGDNDTSSGREANRRVEVWIE